MRILFTVALLFVLPAQAWELAQPVPPTALQDASTRIIAQTGWPNRTNTTLLADTCGWPGGAMRAQQVRPDRSLRWGCWGYNETGVQIQWQDHRMEFVDFLELFVWQDGWHRQMGYTRLHQRVLLSRNGG